jgi:hypothetical protein
MNNRPNPLMAPNDFWLFPDKVYLKGTNISGKTKKMTKALNAIPQQQFQKCFQQSQHRWAKCIAAQGECFEDDSCQ